MNSLGLDVADNRAVEVPCYLPGYTFVEKLSAVCRKYQQEQAGKTMPVNFIRHYYDIYKLLEDEKVRSFIGTSEYAAHKAKRIREADGEKLANCEALLLRDSATREKYRAEFQRTRALYYDDMPTFDAILERIAGCLKQL